MKRITIILFLVFCSLNMYSQLQNQFFGCTLGYTSERSVFDQLKQKGYNPFYSYNVLVINNPSFGGAKWPCVAFYFKNDKLSEVRFMQDRTTSTIHSIRNTFNTLRRKLKEKYDNYKFEEDTQVVTFGDEKTLIALSLEEEDIPCVKLQYFYAPFVYETMDKGMDEL